ncbi:hypothetical protein OG900_06345 [Streptomyces sp. NBC_00433]
MLGPVRRGARFGRIRDSAEAIDLELTQTLAYHRSVEELDPVHTALVTLRGVCQTSGVTGLLGLLAGC